MCKANVVKRWAGLIKVIGRIPISKANSTPILPMYYYLFPYNIVNLQQELHAQPSVHIYFTYNQILSKKF